MKENLGMLFTILIMLSCGQQENTKEDDTVTKGNISTTLSTDTTKLSRLINIKDYKPTSAKFKYVLADNSGKNERLTVPGPSDSHLQAILYFDKTTFQKLKTKYFSIDYTSPNYSQTEFSFDWLDEDVKDELMRSDTSYHGQQDYFLSLGQSGKLWFLNNKVLLSVNRN